MYKGLMVFLATVAMSASAIAGNEGLMGALLGAGAGAAIGHGVDRTGGSGKGAIIGGIGGYIIGKQLEKKEPPPPPPPPRQKPNWTPPENQQSGDQLQGNTLPQHRCAKGQADFEQAQQARNPEDKVFHLERALRYCPNDARVHNDLGVAYYKRGGQHDRDRAKDEFRQALKLKPDYTIARNNLNAM